MKVGKRKHRGVMTYRTYTFICLLRNWNNVIQLFKALYDRPSRSLFVSPSVTLSIRWHIHTSREVRDTSEEVTPGPLWSGSE